MNIHFDNPLQSLAKQTLTTLTFYSLICICIILEISSLLSKDYPGSKSLASPLISAVISLTWLLFNLTTTSIKNILLQTHLNQTIIALDPTSTYQSLSLPP